MTQAQGCTHYCTKSGRRVRLERHATERHVGTLIVISEKGKRIESFEPWEMKRFYSKYKPLKERISKGS